MRWPALALVLAACASAPPPAPPPAPDPADPWPKPPAKVHSLPSEDASHSAGRDLNQILAGLEALSPSLSFYPPRIADDAERDRAYGQWSELLRDLRAVPLEQYPDEVTYHAIFAETYRLGYNLGVKGAASLAEENLAYCLGQDGLSDPCHRTRAALYLSERATNERLMLTEASLNTLRATSEKPDERVEASYVALRALSLDEPGMFAAIDHYLELFSEGESADTFRKFKEKWDK